MPDRPDEHSVHRPEVLLFDVNETLVDIDALAPLFEQQFGGAAVLREWFGQLVLYSMTTTLAGTYADFFTLARGVATMVGRIHDIAVDSTWLDHLVDGMLTMPAHPDVPPALERLKFSGFRLATLTNSPPDVHGRSALRHSGLAAMFERTFTVHQQRAFKPAPQVYLEACAALGIAPSDCMMVAAHPWDTLGAQKVGCRAALITREGNAALPLPSLPQPEIEVPDLHALCERLTALSTRS